MAPKRFVPGISLIVVAILTIAVQQLAAQNEVQKVIVGDAKVTVLHSYDGRDKLAKPSQIRIVPGWLAGGNSETVTGPLAVASETTTWA